MRPSEQNEPVFSKRAAIFESDYWRDDEEEAARFLKPGRLLIGGVGAGRTVGHLLNRGFDIQAVDISPEMVRRCKGRWPQIPVTVQDLQKTSFGEAQFDSIFLPFHTIAYVDDVDATLREMRRILRPDGVLVFSVPNHWYARSIVSGDVFRGKRRSTPVKRGEPGTLATSFLSFADIGRVRKIFPAATVRGRISLSGRMEAPNWKDRVLRMAPFLDKSLYFFCKA